MDSMGAWQNGQWGLFSMAKDMKREQEIFDKGYNAVRQIAKEMVENGASLSDILFMRIRFGMSSKLAQSPPVSAPLTS
jgi:hypothetical protein